MQTSEDPIAFYYKHHFYDVDDHNLHQLGNLNYFEEYYKKFLSKGYLLTDKKGIFKFTNDVFKDLYEGYIAILPYLLESNLKKYPISGLIGVKKESSNCFLCSMIIKTIPIPLLRTL